MVGIYPDEPENAAAYKKFIHYGGLAFMVLAGWMFVLVFALVGWAVAPDSWFAFVLRIPTLTILL